MYPVLMSLVLHCRTVTNDNFTASVTLMSGVLQTLTNSDTIRIGILNADFMMINTISNLGTFTNNTFLSVPRSAFSDTSGNMVVRIPSDNALQASAVTGDTTAPILRGFEFRLDRDIITLSFSEAVNIDTLDPTQITVHSMQNASAGGVSRQLTGGEAVFCQSSGYRLGTVS